MQLYQLIQSMTKSERRYFKSYTKSGASGQQAKYLSLFDVLCKAKDYDEKKIAGKGFTYDDKYLLMEKILEALHVFQPRISVDAEILMLLNQAAILYEKNIRDEMDKRLQRAKKLASENERLYLLLRVIRMQMELGRTPLLAETPLDKELMEVKEKLSRQINYEYNYFQYSKLSYEDPALVKPGSREYARQLSFPPHLPDLSDDSSLVAKLYYHVMKADYSFTFDEKEKNIFHTQKMVQLITENKFILAVLPNTVARMYFYSIIFLEKANQPFQEDLDILKTIESIPTNSHHTLYVSYGYGLAYCTIKLDKLCGEFIISKIDSEKNLLKNNFSRMFLWICGRVMMFYGTFGEWKKAQVWLNRILSDKTGYRGHDKFKARFYSLIIYYELEIGDFKTHLQSLQKYLQRNNHYNEIDKKIIQIMYDISATIQDKEKLILWKKLYHLLQDESILMSGFYIPIDQLKQWCKSKIEGITIAEAIRREKVEVVKI